MLVNLLIFFLPTESYFPTVDPDKVHTKSTLLVLVHNYSWTSIYPNERTNKTHLLSQVFCQFLARLQVSSLCSVCRLKLFSRSNSLSNSFQIDGDPFERSSDAKINVSVNGRSNRIHFDIKWSLKEFCPREVKNSDFILKELALFLFPFLLCLHSLDFFERKKLFCFDF